MIGLDYSHNNFLALESSSFGEFTQFLFTSGYKLGKIETGFNSLDNLDKYNVIILSTPRNTSLKLNEIKILEKYVKNGGSLLIVSSSGGDYTNSTNLNDLTQKFGFEFVSDEIYDSVNYVNLQKRPIITSIKPHVITDQIKKIVFSSSCSTKILDFIEDEKNVKIQGLMQSGLNCWRKRYDGEYWVEEDSPKIQLMVVVEYFKGKVVGFGNLSIFSSLAREYGFSAFDNDILIANILSFLIGSLESEGKPVTIELNLDLYYWVEGIVKKEKWDNVSDLINVSLKYFKDNYDTIIKEIKKLRLERLEKRKAYKKTIEEKERKEIPEDDVIDKVPVLVRKKEDLEDILDALGDLTGEKYEISIELDDEEGNLP
ncbi:MAG: hypothetical protein KAW03_04380, partial [Candidatus Lokiarchaeota archaeon]|nr:hypothetical protein [Candidatus Lokiarchaeota archaeon]